MDIPDGYILVIQVVFLSSPRYHQVPGPSALAKGKRVEDRSHSFGHSLVTWPRLAERRLRHIVLFVSEKNTNWFVDFQTNFSPTCFSSFYSFFLFSLFFASLSFPSFLFFPFSNMSTDNPSLVTTK